MSDTEWQDDPASDERWNAGVDYAQQQLCKVLGVDPATVNWDAATETLDGDVQSVIHGIIEKALGEDWQDLKARDAAVTAKALQMAADWHAAKEKEQLNLFRDNIGEFGNTSIRYAVHKESRDAILALSPDTTGYVMVPVEPTEAMLDAGRVERNNDRLCSEIYRAMIGAKP